MTKNVWDYQESDTSKSWEAFQFYRDTGRSRSMLDVSLKHAKNLPTLKKWSVKHDWVERANAYDLYQDEIRRIADEQEREQERAQRREIVRFATQLVKEQGDRLGKLPKHDRKPAEVKAFLNIMQPALDQSRQEYNDLPTKRVELIDQRLLQQTIDAIRKMGQEPEDVFGRLVEAARDVDAR